MACPGIVSVVVLVHQVSDWCSGVAIKMGRRQGARKEHIWIDTWLRSNAAADPFSSQPSGLRAFRLAALSLIGQRPQRVFSLFASRIQPKFAAAPLHQSLTWCTNTWSLIAAELEGLL